MKDYMLPAHILRKSSMPSGLARKDINKIYGEPAAPVQTESEPAAPAPVQTEKPKRGPRQANAGASKRGPKSKHAAPVAPDDNGGDDGNGADE